MLPTKPFYCINIILNGVHTANLQNTSGYKVLCFCCGFVYWLHRQPDFKYPLFDLLVMPFHLLCKNTGKSRFTFRRPTRAGKVHRWPCRPDEVLVIVCSFYCCLFCCNNCRRNGALFWKNCRYVIPSNTSLLSLLQK